MGRGVRLDKSNSDCPGARFFADCTCDRVAARPSQTMGRRIASCSNSCRQKSFAGDLIGRWNRVSLFSRTVLSIVARWTAQTLPSNCSGDEAAASGLYERYSRRLYVLATAQMSDRLRQRMAPDDIIQSVFRTFFRRADQWTLEQDRSGALWHLLVRITLNKIRSKGLYHNAQRRSPAAEIAISGDFDLGLVAHEPTPLEAAALAEELEVTFAELQANEAHILQLAIHGYTSSEVASQVGCSRWTVRRVLDRIGHRLLQRLE